MATGAGALRTDVWGATGVNIVSSITGNFNRWTYYSLVKNGTTYSMYINGTYKSSNTMASDTSGVGDLALGYYGPAPGSGIIGYIDEFAVWNRTLTTAEIIEASLGITPPSPPPNLTADGYCYQEYANMSNECGALSTGTYAVDESYLSWIPDYANLYDGNYSTAAKGSDTLSGQYYALLIIKYYKPELSSNNSLWQVKLYNNTLNFTIPQDCWSYNNEYIEFRIRNGARSGTPYDFEELYLYCNGDGLYKTLIYNISTGAVINQALVYEEAMYWNLMDNTFRFYDEINSTLINDVTATLYHDNVSQVYTTSNGHININYSSNTPHRLRYSSSGYVMGDYYYLPSELSDDTITTLYLQRNISSEVTFLIYDYGGNIIPDAYIEVNTYVNGSLTPVTYMYSDYLGSATVYMNESNLYSVCVSKTNYVSRCVDITPVYSSYTIRIGQITYPNYTSSIDNLYFKIQPIPTMMYQNVSYLLQLNVSSTTQDFTYYGINVNDTVDIIDNVSYELEGSTITLNFTPPINDTRILPIRITYYFKTDGNPEYNITRIVWAYPYNLTNNTMPSGFSYLKNALSLSNGEDLFSGILVTFITLGLLGLIRQYTPITDPNSLALMGIIMLGVFASLQLFNWVAWSLFAVPYVILKLLSIRRQVN